MLQVLAGNESNRKAIMMCFFAADLEFASKCLLHHVVSEHTKRQKSWKYNRNTFKCSIVAGCLFLSQPAAAAHRPLVQYEGPGSELCCTSNGQYTAASLTTLKSNRHVAVCVGCLKRHVSRERPPRAASLSMSPMQTVQTLQGLWN